MSTVPSGFEWQFNDIDNPPPMTNQQGSPVNGQEQEPIWRFDAIAGHFNKGTEFMRGRNAAIRLNALEADLAREKARADEGDVWVRIAYANAAEEYKGRISTLEAQVEALKGYKELAVEVFEDCEHRVWDNSGGVSCYFCGRRAGPEPNGDPVIVHAAECPVSLYKALTTQDQG